MSWRTNPLMLGLRNLGCATGMNRLAALVRHGCEEDYGIGLGSCIRPGDTVWDIGANVGLYTRRFAALTNEHGLVIAFEPSPINFARLEQVCAPLANVHLHCCGLGDLAGRLYLQQGARTSLVVETTRIERGLTSTHGENGADGSRHARTSAWTDRERIDNMDIGQASASICFLAVWTLAASFGVGPLRCK